MFNDKTILITGGTGSWGQELTKQLLGRYNPKEIRIYSRGEEKQVSMMHRFNNPKIKFVLGDVRDKERLDIRLQRADIVFHLAALKHVPICETHPFEAIQTNIIGTQNVVSSAIKNKVKIGIFATTDKGVDPLNIYGSTKSCAEKLVIAANLDSMSETVFSCFRAGNLLGTTGSVVPLFKQQLKLNNEITLTDKSMTRFFMPVKETIRLLLKCAEKAVGGEIFVTKMPSLRINDLAEVMMKSLGNYETKMRVIGIRPGEKIHEILVSKYEKSRAIEEDDYFIVLPNIKIPTIEKKYGKNIKGIEREFTSEAAHVLDKDGIKKMLEDDGWLDDGIKDLLISKLSEEELKSFGMWRREQGGSLSPSNSDKER